MSSRWDAVHRWHFDLPTLIITLVVAPLAVYLLGILRKHGKEWSGYVLEGFCYQVGRLLIHSLAARFSLKRYCRLELQKDNKFLYVPSRNDIKLAIDKVFVNLTLEEQTGGIGSYDQNTLFLAGNRLRIIGDPGSGKSSLVKRLFRNACLDGIAKPARSRLPILVELKNLSVPKNLAGQRLGTWFYDFLEKTVEKSAVYGMKDCFTNYARVSGFLVLLDGLDEVASSSYERVQAAVIALSDFLANLSSDNVIVLTMRTQLHQQVREAFRDNFGKALFVKPLTPTDVYEFLSRWPFDDRRVAPSIYSELTDRPTLREMCTNPLILAMYVAERQSGADPVTPESRTDFYRRVLDELLIKRRLRQTGPTPAPGKLREQRERILGRLAYDHLLDPSQAANSLRWSDAISVVKDVMRCNDDEAERIFLEIARDTGLLSQERERESFRFIHLTFCEFLAAREAVEGRRDGFDSLIALHRRLRGKPKARGASRLLEAVPFSCGLVPRSRRDEVISQIAELRDERLLARCFLETKNYEHPAWKTFAQDTRDSLLRTAEADWDENWLQELHLFNVVVRDAVQCSTHIPTARVQLDLGEFYRELLQRQGSNSLPKLLGAYASHDAPAALRLAEVSGLDLPSHFPEVIIDNSDQIPFLSLIVNKLLSDTDGTGLMWAPPLAEAGLTSRLVAHFLSGKPGDHSGLEDSLKRVPSSRRWDVSGLTGESLYTQLLTLAVGAFDASKPCYKRLPILMKVRPPGSLKAIRPNTTLLILFLTLASWGLAEVLGVWEPMRLMGTLRPIAKACAMSILITAYILSIRSMSLQIFYRMLINLSSFPVSTSVRFFRPLPFLRHLAVPLPFPFLRRSQRDLIAEMRGLGGESGRLGLALPDDSVAIPVQES